MSMVKYSGILMVLIVVSILYYYISKKIGIIDKPNYRSSHKSPTSQGGGVLFLFGLWIYFLTSNFSYPYFILGTTMVAIVSFMDDLKNISIKVRFLFHFIAVSLCMTQIELFELPLWTNCVVLIMGLGFINFYNFMDGINGITGLYSLVVLSGLYFVNKEASIVDADLIIILMISVLIFGFYNFRKKAIWFAGDIGSISMAVIIFFIGLALYFNLNAPVIILFGVVYGADATLTLLYRRYLGEKLTEPHRDHIYQKLVDVKKLPHMLVSGIYALIQLFVNIIVVKTFKISFQEQLLVFGSVVIAIIALYVVAFLLITNKYSKLEA